MLLLFRVKPNNTCKYDIRSLPRPADTNANQISSWHVLRTSAHLTASAEVVCYCSSLDLWTSTLHVPFSAINTIQKETVRHKLRTNHLQRVHVKTNTKLSGHAAPTTWLKRLSLTRGGSGGVLCDPGRKKPRSRAVTGPAPGQPGFSYFYGGNRRAAARDLGNQASPCEEALRVLFKISDQHPLALPSAL